MDSSRRTFLETVGASSLLLFAGCQEGDDGDDPTESATKTNTDAATTGNPDADTTTEPGTPTEAPGGETPTETTHGGETPTEEPTPTETETPTPEPTDPPTETDEPTPTETETETETDTPTETETDTPTETETETPEETPEETETPQESETPKDDGDGENMPESGPRSAAQFDMDDGFPEVAPWLDDDTPVYVVDEPTREAFVDAVDRSGPRVVVFETSGTIDLDGEWVRITDDKLWLAGQTAPSPGITIVRGRVQISAGDCVIQHLRFRPGDEGGGNPDSMDSLSTADGTTSNVIDHCSAGWSVDETFSVGYDSHDTTVTNCLIAEPLHDSIHSKGPHGYGSLTGDGATNVTYAGNVWAHCNRRTPRLKAETESAVVNNVTYHFENAIALDYSTTATIQGNAFLRVNTDDRNIDGSRRDGDSTVAYITDNYSEPETEMDNGQFDYRDSPPVWPYGLSALSADDVEEHNLEHAGARPADRSEHDERVIEQVRDRTGDYVDSQSEVGGYPDLAENSRDLDIPDDDLRAWLRREARAVEPDPWN